MGIQEWTTLSPLKKAVKKIRFILSFNMSKLRLLSSILSSKTPPRLSFKDRVDSGLQSFVEDFEGYESASSSSCALQRTSSYVSDEDIDSKADMFIANFHRQLRLERQISLELQYCKSPA
ncbi:hypothetical protein ACHQM5_030165 [Ranunculus cassubicifolius]